MSSKNDETTAVVMVFACLGAMAIMLAAFVFAVLAFLSLLLTFVALCAWSRPRRIGKFILEPEEARAFVYRGLAGSFLLPTFVAFCALLFGFNIQDSVWPYLFLGGYVAGSIGIEILMADQNGGGGAVDITPPQVPSAPPRSLPRPEPEPFRFASWDDEEERGR